MWPKLIPVAVLALVVPIAIGVIAPAQAGEGPDEAKVRLNGANGNLLPYSPNCNADWCYGTAWFGGDLNMGAIYRVKPNGERYKVLASFEATNGL